MIKLKIILCVLCTLCLCYGLPVQEKKQEDDQEKTKTQPQEGEDWELNLEYGRYLKEVVQTLESDAEFRKKLETADVEDIKSGKISRELHLVDHKVRTKLDELKRGELERLRQIAVKEHEKKIGVDRSKLKMPAHVDSRDPTKFETEDLRKLIMQLNQDLEEVDKKRQDEFKQYEIEKQYKYQHDLEGMDEEHKKQTQQEHEEQLRKHKEHPKLHHPGSKHQLEEVWEEQDHMKSEDFDPKVFFHLHDLDGNNQWDENEVKSLFQKELDKMYDPNAPEDNLMERYEEMERMREHVFKESDVNNDKFISFEEFMEQTRKNEFERDEGWQGLDEQEVFSQQEYEAYERQRQEEIQQLVESGAIPPPPGYHGLNAPQPLALGEAPHVYQTVPQGYQALPQGYQAVPQGYQAVPQGQVYQAVPQGQGYQGVPQVQGYQAATGQNVPPVRDIPPKPVAPQAQAALSQQGVPQPIIHSQAMPPQGIPQVQAVPQGQGTVQKVPDQQHQYQQQPPQQQQQQYQQPPQQQQYQQQLPQQQQQQYQQQPPQQQQQQGGLNLHPEIKPVASNQLPGSK